MAIGNFVKHYNTASHSITIQEIFRKGGHKSYAVYWLMIEILSQKFDGECVIIELHEQELVKHLRIRSDCLVKELQKTWNSSLSLIERDGTLFRINAPILLDLLHRDYKRARTERVQSAPKNKELRIKNKEVEEEKATTAMPIQKFFIPEEINVTYQTVMGYPDWVIEHVAKEAWPIYIADSKPGKEWPRFLSHYIRNDKENITALIDDKISQQRLAEKYKDYE